VLEVDATTAQLTVYLLHFFDSVKIEVTISHQLCRLVQSRAKFKFIFQWQNGVGLCNKFSVGLPSNAI